MTVKVIIATQDQYAPQIRELFLEYLQWAISRANEEYGVKFDIATILEADMKELGKFMPPHGRLLLCYAEDQLAGIACLKQLTPTMGEIKRMYVRPAHRKQGLGHALTHRLIEEASQIGYQRVRLDSARFMHDAHHLYRTAGFSEIDAYEGSEIPKEFQPHWIFMELELQGKKGWGAGCRGLTNACSRLARRARFTGRSWSQAFGLAIGSSQTRACD
jgi:GNAT superfamily N-acetyltransferase